MKQFLFRSAAILISAGIVLASLETILRLHPPQWLTVRMKMLAMDDFGSDKNASVRVKNGKFLSFAPLSSFPLAHYEYSILVNIDEYGGRKSNPRPLTSKDIPTPFFGDSFTMGIGVKDNETYVSLIADYIKQPVLNLGVAGSCLIDQMNVLESRYEEIGRPKKVLFTIFIGNDFADIQNSRYAGNESSGASIKKVKTGRGDLLGRWNKVILHNAAVKKVYSIQWIKALAVRAMNRFGPDKKINPIFLTIVKNDPFLDNVKDRFNSALDRLEDLSQRLGFRPYFIIIPDPDQLDSERLKNDSGYYGIRPEDLDVMRPNRILASWLEAHRFEYVDTSDSLKADLSGAYYVLDNHLTAKGHRIVFESIKGAVREWLANGPEGTLRVG